MFNVGQSSASIFSPICIHICTGHQLIHSNRINHELYSEPTFPAPQLYLIRHTLSIYHTVHVYLVHLLYKMQEMAYITPMQHPGIQQRAPISELIKPIGLCATQNAQKRFRT